MESDRTKWNEKFKVRTDQLFPPEPFLLRNVQLFRTGTVLDLASGDGRNAIHLAKLGFLVTAVDIADVALERLKRFSLREATFVTTRLVDLDCNPIAPPLGTFDNVVVNHFKPPEHLWRNVPRWLRPGGRLFICAFNMKQSQAYGMSKHFCLEVDEYKESHPGLKLLQYESFSEGDNFLDGYIFEKE